jgi:integrase
VPLILREKQSGVIVYARWRDSTRSQRTQRLGVAWVERHGDRWRNRRGTKPEETLSIDDATVRMRALIDEHEARVADAAADYRAGVRDRSAATFEDAALAWFDHGRDVTGWRPSTLEDRHYTLCAHLLPAFGDRPLRAIDRDEVRRWWRGLHDPRRKGGRLSDRNANKLITELRAIFNWARDDYRLSENPADGIRKHPVLTSERRDFFSVEEVAALVRAADSERDALIYQAAVYAGLRRGEIMSLRWRCIDFARSNIHITESVSAGQDSLTKDREGRSLPLVPQLAQALAAWRPADAHEDHLVFPGTLPGRKLDGNAVSKRYRAARDRAGLRPLRFHDLRHTFGSLAVDGGASLVQVQAWMGHSAIQTTMIYLHSKSRTADAARLGAAFEADAVAQVGR